MIRTSSRRPYLNNVIIHQNALIVAIFVVLIHNLISLDKVLSFEISIRHQEKRLRSISYPSGLVQLLYDVKKKQDMRIITRK